MRKKIKLYALVYADNPDQYLCISHKMSLLQEYAEHLLQLDHKDHYIAWCENRGFNFTDYTSWNTYFTDCITDEEKEGFKIVRLIYRIENIAAALRMFSLMLPLGTSMDTPNELWYLKDRINKHTINEEGIDLIEDARQMYPNSYLNTFMTALEQNIIDNKQENINVNESR